MWLLIDDVRNLDCDVIARTPESARDCLSAFQNKLECVCIDHDLGTAESGYDVIKWAVSEELLPNHVQIVSSNPVGVQNIANVLSDNGYESLDGRNWRKK